MFFHNLKYSLKILFRNRMLIFWTFAFPIILGTLFNLAFSNIENSEQLKIIDIGIVDDEDFQENEVFKSAIIDLSDKDNPDRLFKTKFFPSENEANEKLENGDIVGFLKFDGDKASILVLENGINQTIFKYVTEEILQTADSVENIVQNEVQEEIKKGNYNISYDEINNRVNEILEENDANLKNISKSNLSYTMIEFYTLIAMACLYGGNFSMTSINQNLANMSNKGKRIAVSSIKKSETILSSLFASYLVQLIGIALLFIYTIFVLKVDYGDKIGLIILLSMVGSLAGLTLGMFTGVIFKTNENAKVGILIGFTMLGCYFSGMMGITMKYIIDKNVPILSKINPASQITDGFYSLYYYDTLNRFWGNITALLIFAFVLTFVSFFSLRRQKYDSI